MLPAYNSYIAGVCHGRGSIGLPSNSFRGYALCVATCFDLRIRKMAVDMPATRTIGIPAPKPAAKAILGFVLLEDEVEATLGMKATPCVVAEVEVLLATSVVYWGIWTEYPCSCV